MTTVDYLIVGSGLTGSTIARRLADAGREVLILERRAHFGGNVHDTVHPSGVRVHTYGPHYFRCSSPRIWEYVNRFSRFHRFEARVKVLTGGAYEDWPVNKRTVQQYSDWVPPKANGKARNFEEACLRKLPPEIYRKLVEGYTRRQWGVEPSRLDPELARRIRINEEGQQSLTAHCRYQALPVHGYAQWMAAMIDGIPTVQGVDYLQRRDEFRARKLLVMTGSLDEFFGFDEGRLHYRGQRRQHVFHPDHDSFQPCLQVNHPDSDENSPLRSIEWKYLLPPQERQKIAGTVVTHEFPFSPTAPDQFEYPFQDAHNKALARRYIERAARIPNLLMCGRLGDYRYYDMDHAIGRALYLSDQLLGETYISARSARPANPAPAPARLPRRVEVEEKPHAPAPVDLRAISCAVSG